MKKLIFLSSITIVIFFIFGGYLLSQNEQNKFSKKIKDNTPTIVKKILKNTVLYVPFTKREIKNLNSIIDKLNNDNDILTLENYKLNNISIMENINLKTMNWKTTILILFSDNENLHGNKKSGYIETYKDKIILVFTSGKIILNKIHLLKIMFLNLEISKII